MFLILSALILTGNSSAPRTALLLAFYPNPCSLFLKVALDLIFLKKREGGCLIQMLQLVVKTMIYLSLGLTMAKLTGNADTFSWTGIVVPLWIVTGFVVCFFICAFILLCFKLITSVISSICIFRDILVALWATINTGSFCGLSIYLLLTAPKYGDGYISISVFFLPAIIGSCITFLLAIVTIIWYAKL